MVQAHEVAAAGQQAESPLSAIPIESLDPVDEEKFLDPTDYFSDLQAAKASILEGVITHW